MKNKGRFKKLIYLVVAGMLGISSFCFGTNPFITHLRTADPSAHVWADGKMWVYASHDQNNATNYDSMDGYHVFSSADLINWTDHGEVLHSRNVNWGLSEGGFMWAPDCAYKNGTYYFYFPHKNQEEQWRIGVATSANPAGPFNDIGHYIEGTSGIDPCCFIDDDGQAYLYFGDALVAKLKSNMIELDEPARKVDYGASNFREGAWMHKRNGIYYYSYTDYKPKDYNGFYSMGDNPYGPFSYKGPLNKKPDGAQDHHSIIEYHGQWYYFYHVGDYNGGNVNRRNSCVDYLHYNPDGTIKMIEMTEQGVNMVDPGPTPANKICGDADSSGVVDIIDALIISQYYVGILSVEIDLAVCDVNNDGNIDIIDALIIAQFTVGLITVLNC